MSDFDGKAVSAVKIGLRAGVDQRPAGHFTALMFEHRTDIRFQDLSGLDDPPT